MLQPSRCSQAAFSHLRPSEVGYASIGLLWHRRHAQGRSLSHRAVEGTVGSDGRSYCVPYSNQYKLRKDNKTLIIVLKNTGNTLNGAFGSRQSRHCDLGHDMYSLTVHIQYTVHGCRVRAAHDESE